MALDTAEIVSRWERGMATAAEKYKKGIQNTTVNPMERAAASADRYAAGVQRAVSEGRYQRGLARVSKDQWQQASIDKGAARLASGAAASRPKYTEFWTRFGPYLQNVKDRVRQMPRGTLEENLNRMMENARLLSQFRNRN